VLAVALVQAGFLIFFVATNGALAPSHRRAGASSCFGSSGLPSDFDTVTSACGNAATLRSYFDQSLSLLKSRVPSLVTQQIEGAQNLHLTSSRQDLINYVFCKASSLGYTYQPLLNALSGSGVRQQPPTLPTAEPAYSKCDNVDVMPESRYRAMVAAQVAAGLLAAQAYVCVETALGENVAATCIPLSIAASATASYFQYVTWCSGEDTANTVTANYDRLATVSQQLFNSTELIQQSVVNATSYLASLINNSTADIENLINADTNEILDALAQNTTAIITDLRQVGCDAIRLLNIPDGQRSSNDSQCIGQPGYPYVWAATK